MRHRLLVLSAVACAITGLLMSPSTARPASASIKSVPVLAYYYIWFDEASWNRAKIDYPILGRYASDDVVQAVMIPVVCPSRIFLSALST